MARAERQPIRVASRLSATSGSVRVVTVSCSVVRFVILALCRGVGLRRRACGPLGREYELRGQVLAVDQARQEITIKHEDIPRFMPGMTMPFKVRDARLLEGRVPGDLVKATLVVEDAAAHLRAIERTGYAPLTEPSPPTRVMDLLEPGDNGPRRAFWSTRRTPPAASPTGAARCLPSRSYTPAVRCPTSAR